MTASARGLRTHRYTLSWKWKMFGKASANKPERLVVHLGFPSDKSMFLWVVLVKRQYCWWMDVWIMCRVCVSMSVCMRESEQPLERMCSLSLSYTLLASFHDTTLVDCTTQASFSGYFHTKEKVMEANGRMVGNNVFTNGQEKCKVYNL